MIFQSSEHPPNDVWQYINYIWLILKNHILSIYCYDYITTLYLKQKYWSNNLQSSGPASDNRAETYPEWEEETREVAEFELAQLSLEVRDPFPVSRIVYCRAGMKISSQYLSFRGKLSYHTAFSIITVYENIHLFLKNISYRKFLY